MAYLTANPNTPPPLDELVLYPVLIAAIDTDDSDHGRSLHISYSFPDEQGDYELFDFVGYQNEKGFAIIGKDSSGDVSRFRSFANACAGRREDVEITGFDDESLTVTYPGSAFQLRTGLALRIAGKLKPSKKDPDKLFFKVTTYRAALVADAA